MVCQRDISSRKSYLIFFNDSRWWNCICICVDYFWIYWHIYAKQELSEFHYLDLICSQDAFQLLLKVSTVAAWHTKTCLKLWLHSQIAHNSNKRGSIVSFQTADVKIKFLDISAARAKYQLYKIFYSNYHKPKTSFTGENNNSGQGTTFVQEIRGWQIN